MSNRQIEWNMFADIVEGHVVNYTIPQYGDLPNDMIMEWSVEDCLMAINRYITRSKVSRRGEIESLRDLVKIAHYACVAFHKKLDVYQKEGIDTISLVERIQEGK